MDKIKKVDNKVFYKYNKTQHLNKLPCRNNYIQKSLIKKYNLNETLNKTKKLKITTKFRKINILNITFVIKKNLNKSYDFKNKKIKVLNNKVKNMNLKLNNYKNINNFKNLKIKFKKLNQNKVKKHSLNLYKLNPKSYIN